VIPHIVESGDPEPPRNDQQTHIVVLAPADELSGEQAKVGKGVEAEHGDLLNR
jgi:hypothetical protein